MLESKHKSNENIRYNMIWDRKSTSFIDNTMITYNQSRLLLLEPGPGSSSTSSKCTSMYLSSSQTSSWEMEWVLMKEKGRNEEFWGNSHNKAANAWGKEGMWNGHSFTVLMLRCGMRPQHLILYGKRWLFGWVTGYRRWISWETSNSPWISMNSLQIFIFF